MSDFDKFLGSEAGRITVFTTALSCFAGALSALAGSADLVKWVAILAPLLAITAFVAVVTLAAEDHGKVVIYLLLGLPLVGGLYWKRATAAGAYLGFTLGAALPLTYIFADLLTQFGIGWAGTLVEFFPSIGKRGLYSFALGFVGIGIGSMLPFSKPKPYTIRTNSRPSRPLWNELANCLGDRPLRRHWSVHSGVSGRCHQGLWQYSQSAE